MKIQFDDKSYIEIKKSANNKILIMVQAKDVENPLKKITNTVEIDKAQFETLIADVHTCLDIDTTKLKE